jgi:hypothetical protein
MPTYPLLPIDHRAMSMNVSSALHQEFYRLVQDCSRTYFFMPKVAWQPYIDLLRNSCQRFKLLIPIYLLCSLSFLINAVFKLMVDDYFSVFIYTSLTLVCFGTFIAFKNIFNSLEQLAKALERLPASNVIEIQDRYNL